MPRAEDIQLCADPAGEGRGLSIAETRLEDVEITSAGRSWEKLIQAQRELGEVHTVVMDSPTKVELSRPLRASAASVM